MTRIGIVSLIGVGLLPGAAVGLSQTYSILVTLHALT